MLNLQLHTGRVSNQYFSVSMPYLHADGMLLLVKPKLSTIVISNLRGCDKVHVLNC